MSMKQSLQAYKMVLKKLLCKHTLCCWDTHCVCGRMSHFDFDPHTKSTQWILTSSGNSVSHIFFLKHAHGSQHEYTWKQSVDRHIDITPTFHSSFNVYTFEICQIHENNTHNKHMFFLRSLTFVVTLSLHKGKGKSCHLFLSFFFFTQITGKLLLKRQGWQWPRWSCSSSATQPSSTAHAEFVFHLWDLSYYSCDLHRLVRQDGLSKTSLHWQPRMIDNLFSFISTANDGFRDDTCVTHPFQKNHVKYINCQAVAHA